MVRRLGMVVTMLVLMNLGLGVVAGRGVAGVAAQDLTCEDFPNPAAAQALLDADDSFADVLDPDGDGEACTDDDLAELEDQQSQDDEETNQDDEEASDEDEDPLAARFGGAREDFEAEYGDPVSDEEEEYPVGFEYEVDGFRSVTVFYHKDFAAYITLTAERRSPFSQSEAEDVAFDFLPTDFEQGDEPSETEDGDLLIAGHSEALEERFGRSTYDEYGATGRTGDVFFILRFNADNDVTAVEIGLGTEETTGPGGEDDEDEETPEADDDDQDNGDSGDAAAYQAAVCEQVATLSQSILDFFTLIADPDFGSDESIDQLAEILVSWAGAPDDANALDVPAGEEETQESFVEFTQLLFDASANVLTGIQSGDEEVLGTAADQLNQATELGTTLLESC